MFAVDGVLCDTFWPKDCGILQVIDEDKPISFDDGDNSEDVRTRREAHSNDDVSARVEAAVAATSDDEKDLFHVEKDPLLNTIISGRYEIISRIGAGGMGIVYKARQTAMDRVVAVKTLLKELAHDDKVVKRFKNEALAVSRLAHPNTIRIFDFGQMDDGTLFFAMEFLSGSSLDQTLDENGPLSVKRTLHILRQMALSLAEAHSKGIVHRDLKPENVFLTRVDNDGDFVKVLDFGVAKLRESDKRQGTLTQAGVIFGTPRYMSPEQCRSLVVDARADIYAIGVIAYEMLLGATPFNSDNPLGMLIQHVQEKPRPLSEFRPDIEVLPEVEDLVMKCLQKAPDRRFQSSQELAETITRIEKGLHSRFNEVVKVSGQRVQLAKVGDGAYPDYTIADETAAVAGIGLKRRVWPLAVIAGGVTALALVLSVAYFQGVFDGVEDGGLVGTDDALISDVSGTVDVAPDINSDEILTPDSAPGSAGPSSITLRFATTPPGATVFDGDAELGVTPLEIRMDSLGKPKKFLVRKGGFVDREVESAMDLSEGFNLELERIPTTKTVKPVDVRADQKPAEVRPATVVKPAEPAPNKVGDLKKMKY